MKSMTSKDTEVLIVGAGAGGLVLALSLKQIGVECRVYEAVETLMPIGAGVNLLPHASRELDELDLIPALDRVSIRTRASAYFNRFGQHIYTEPAGEAAGYPWPQFSIHRGEMQKVFLDAVLERLGRDSVVTGHRLTGITQQDDHVTAEFVDPAGNRLPSVRAGVVIGCDGIRSTLRKQFYPDEGEPIYSGVTSWRGVTIFPPVLDGATTIFAGWLDTGKLTAYPVRHNADGKGNKLMNWVASHVRPRPNSYDWNRHAKVEDFIDCYADWHFEWFDVPKLMSSTETILIFPQADRDPLPTWTFGRATLLGDAAHPMYPRGSNGAGQAILDARYLAGCIRRRGVTPEALKEYDAIRVGATTKIVLMNRSNPPDTIIKEVEDRSGGKPFKNIDDVISQSELQEITNRYKRVAGFQIEELKMRASLV
jgi:2-polyprenyl-6-methoxyphenol hydroxylase-like FAD-dependent oxidoreductase